MPGGHIRGLRMSMNYDFELLESIDRAVYVLGKKKLRSDDYEILSIYSRDEGAAIEGLKIWSANKGSYFDRKFKTADYVENKTYSGSPILNRVFT